jgi:hypothetical protein
LIIVGASALLEVLLNTAVADRVAARWFAGDETLHAPHLIDIEVAHALRRYSLSGELDPHRGNEADTAPRSSCSRTPRLRTLDLPDANDSGRVEGGRLAREAARPLHDLTRRPPGGAYSIGPDGRIGSCAAPPPERQNP